MPNENEEFDAEIDALLNEGAAPAGEATPAVKVEGQTAPAASAPLKFGGRDWQSADELGKAYEALNRDYTKKGQALKENEKWINWGKAVSKHEDLRARVEREIADHQARLTQQGVAPRQVEEQTRVAQERLDRIEAFVAKQEVDAEIKGLKAKYNLDKDSVNLVIQKAAQLLERKIDLPLEDVYKMVGFDRQAQAAKLEGERVL